MWAGGDDGRSNWVTTKLHQIQRLNNSVKLALWVIKKLFKVIGIHSFSGEALEMEMALNRLQKKIFKLKWNLHEFCKLITITTIKSELMHLSGLMALKPWTRDILLLQLKISKIFHSLFNNNTLRLTFVCDHLLGTRLASIKAQSAASGYSAATAAAPPDR